MDEITTTRLTEMQSKLAATESQLASLKEAARQSNERADRVQVEAVITSALEGRQFVNEKAKDSFAKEIIALHGGRVAGITPTFVAAQFEGDYSYVLRKSGEQSKTGQKRIPSLDDIRPGMSKEALKEIADYMGSLIQRPPVR